MVGSGNRFVYDQNPYSYNETPNFFNQPPPHQIETYLCDLCGSKSHHGFDCQTGNTLVYEQVPCDNQNYGLDRYPYYSLSLPQQFYYCEYHIDQSPPRDLESEILSKIEIDRLQEDFLSTQIPNTFFDLDNEESDDDTEVIFDKELFLRERNTTHVTPQSLTYTPPPPFLATMEPLDSLLMGDEVISTTLARENEEFIKSSVDDLVPILREFEVTLVSTNLECSMPIDLLPLPCTDVLGDAKVDIDLPFGGHFDTLSTGDRKIDFNPSDLETIDPVPDPRILDPTKSTLIIDEATLLVTLLLDFKDISLREVERFDPFFSLTQSGDMTWVMERPSFRFPYMPLPCQVPYSPKVVMYHYFHPTLILSDRCVLEPRSNDDSISRYFDVTISNPLFDFDDNYSLIIDNKIFDDDSKDLCSLDPLRYIGLKTKQKWYEVVRLTCQSKVFKWQVLVGGRCSGGYEVASLSEGDTWQKRVKGQYEVALIRGNDWGKMIGCWIQEF
ncbi:hypothetical protein Tco_0413573 [Tanacetum coccineum]